MVRIGTVWDRTTEVIGGRGNMLAGIAATGIFLPSIVQAAFRDFALPAAQLVGLLAAIVMLWAQLAIVAASSDPSTTGGSAQRIATARFLPAMGVVIIVVIVAAILSLPGITLLIASGFDFAAAQAGRTQGAIDAGKAAGSGLYFFVFALFMLWLGARLIVLYPVIVNERLGLGAIARSFRLTRGLTWKVIGVLILYAIVFLVALMAATSIVGLVFRLILGSDSVALVTFLAGIAGAIVTTIFSVLQAVFTAQLYLAARGPDAAPVGAALPE
ncbi:conserved membrane hypothetical protein [Sphingomonas sp. EC-HK361]|uniref:glycerophosphoryl diester phosphodiesterase membrane domain-containing protein n=1 Tax=Sphingomonas sp. EC-HK361 TaxID=2038397 RepID=UPI00125C75A7|nr:glycerophosphoryl diester phosphodiesterase membrane domain-containing protein [Sphingomonas sp. EC-HK361]VVT16664.1 conserved membrane hypothetical protein [Sphingomonas sp. EC-HK361]